MLFQYTPDFKKIQLVTQRNKMLNASDWTQMPDAALTPELKQSWAEWRQELRDITKKEGFPDIEIPVSPASPDYLK
jgi:hypothetical protein